MNYTATCHCGRVEISFTPLEDLAEAAHCNCSFCRRRAAATVGVNEAELSVTRGQDALTLYQWNTGTAEHYFCKYCGIYTHHRRRSDPTQFGVNLGAIDGVSVDDLKGRHWNEGVNHPADDHP